MPKYLSRPYEVEAFQLELRTDFPVELPGWVDFKAVRMLMPRETGESEPVLRVETPIGPQLAHRGDWLVLAGPGLLVIGPQAFDASYTPASGDALTLDAVRAVLDTATVQAALQFVDDTAVYTAAIGEHLVFDLSTSNLAASLHSMREQAAVTDEQLRQFDVQEWGLRRILRQSLHLHDGTPALLPVLDLATAGPELPPAAPGVVSERIEASL